MRQTQNRLAPQVPFPVHRIAGPGQAQALARQASSPVVVTKTRPNPVPVLRLTAVPYSRLPTLLHFKLLSPYFSILSPFLPPLPPPPPTTSPFTTSTYPQPSLATQQPVIGFLASRSCVFGSGTLAPETSPSFFPSVGRNVARSLLPKKPPFPPCGKKRLNSITEATPTTREFQTNLDCIHHKPLGSRSRNPTAIR